MRQRLLLILGLLVWINVIVFGITEQKDTDDGRQVVPVEHSEKRHFERPAFDALLTGNIRTNPIQGRRSSSRRRLRLFFPVDLDCSIKMHFIANIFYIYR